MAGTFPTMRSGQTVFYPLKDIRSFSTGVHRFLDDTEQRWRSRPMLGRFELTLQDINAYDVCNVRTFFRSQFGRFDSTWSLAFAGNTWTNLAFDQDDFTVTENKRNRYSVTLRVIQVISQLPVIGAAATSYFPQINTSGIITCLPYTSGMAYRTTNIEVASGKRYTWKWRANPLHNFQIRLEHITDSELAVVRNFFYALEGRKGEFGFLDPGGNLVAYSDDFLNASWTRTSLGLGSGQADPFGGSLAYTASTGGSGSLSTPVIPAGNASGFVMCCSVWAKGSSPGQTIQVGFTGIGSTVQTLQVGKWIRVSYTTTLATSAPVSMLISGITGTVYLFGAQCSPLPQPGPRLLTPGADGLHSKCRFDTDNFEIACTGFNDTQVTLPVVEYL